MGQQIRLTQDGRKFIDMSGDDNPCVGCGACCSNFRVSFYHGELSDMPSGFVPVELTVKVNDFYSCMKGTERGCDSCIALTGTIGKKVGCSIYENRPTPCREFSVWDSQGEPNPICQKLRKKINLPELKKIKSQE